VYINQLSVQFHKIKLGQHELNTESNMPTSKRGGYRFGAGAPSKWNHQPTQAIRVPQQLVPEILQYATHLDSEGSEQSGDRTSEMQKQYIDNFQSIDYYQSMKPAVPPVEIFKALGDEYRLQILDYLASSQSCCEPGDGICACDLQSLTGLSQGTVSHHMKVLVQALLVKYEKRGKWIYYSINPEGCAAALELPQRYLKLRHFPSSSQMENPQG
jgi:ArsR family transcriptional regulator